MRNRTIFIDSFSGSASDLKGKNRTAENVLSALRHDSRLSTWDISEHVWLRVCIADLKRRGLIQEVYEPYPWHRFIILAPKTSVPAAVNEPPPK